ncbi:MAG: hypothetical protein ABSB09_02925 [Acidimicrobiales bacterium]|jgi:hypothetical protein
MIVHPVAGGWGIFSHWAGDDGVIVRARFTVRDDGRLQAADVHIEGRPNVTRTALRSLPLGSIEAWANGRGREDLVRSIAESGPSVFDATDEWLRTVGGGDRDLVIPIGSPRVRSLRLRIPDGPKRPDSFYRKVAELYSVLIEQGSHRPAAEIAKANPPVPVTTVHRWIKEARARKLLPSAGSKGKAG